MTTQKPDTVRRLVKCPNCKRQFFTRKDESQCRLPEGCGMRFFQA